MKVAIDCRSLRHRPTGIPNFLISVINNMSAQNPDWEIILLSNASFNDDNNARINYRDNIKVVISPFFVLKDVAILWYVFKVYFLLKSLKPDIFYAPNFILPPLVPSGITTVLTVHDVIFIEYRDTLSLGTKFIFKLFINSSINKADVLWVNSEYTKSELTKYYPNRKCKNIFVGCAIDKNIYRSKAVEHTRKQELFKKYNLTEKVILFVGTVEPRKNLKFLLSLMPALASENYSLLVIGASGWGNTYIKEQIHSGAFPKDNVCFTGFLSTEEIVELYNISSLFVSTSLNEGFGLPQLEAMNCGCPVVTAHNSAMIEVVEGAGETVEGWNEADWITAINKVYNNRNSYVQRGYVRANEYLWDDVISNFNQYIANL